GALLNADFADFNVEAFFAEGGVDEIENVGAQQQLGDAITNEVVGRKDVRSASSQELCGSFLFAGASNDFEVGAKAARSENDVEIFGVAADRGDKSGGAIDMRLLQIFLAGSAADDRRNFLVDGPLRALRIAFDDDADLFLRDQLARDGAAD